MNTISKIYNFIKEPGRYKNAFYIKYHLMRYWQKIMVGMGLKKKAEFHDKDTFDWSLYTLHYKGELKESSKEFTQSLNQGDYIFSNNKLIKANDKIKPIHFNHHLLYETILQLGPNSVFELGCGNGMHLHNLQVLSPNIKLSGIDLLDEQLKFLHELYPDLKADLKQMDATVPFPDDTQKSDLVFSQAVLMHIHTDDLHRVALANMFKLANKYVLLYESERKHNYVEDVKKLSSDGKINWEKIFIYTRINEITGQQASLIISNQELNYQLIEKVKVA